MCVKQEGFLLGNGAVKTNIMQSFPNYQSTHIDTTSICNVYKGLSSILN